MDIIDKHFQALPPKRKAFTLIIAAGHILVAIYAYVIHFTTLAESFLLCVIGLLYAELLKLHYRLENVEKNKSKDSRNNSSKSSQKKSKKKRT